MKNQYEHHTSIGGKAIFPFIMRHLKNCTTSDCNWHENIEILFISEGSGYIKYDADTMKLDTGDIVIINSDAIHYIYSNTLISFYYLIIDDSFLSENGIEIKKYVFTKKTRDKKTADIYMNAANQIENTCDSLNIAKARNAVLSLAIELCSKHALIKNETEKRKSKSEECVKKAMNFINENYASRVSLESISDALKLSKAHLSRIFKEYTGQTVHFYINTLRCKQARQLILSGISITEAAMECGFESLSYFSRTYKKIMNESPSERKKAIY